MSRNPVTYQHMEEFLIGTGKKRASDSASGKDRTDLGSSGYYSQRLSESV